MESNWPALRHLYFQLCTHMTLDLEHILLKVQWWVKGKAHLQRIESSLPIFGHHGGPWVHGGRGGKGSFWTVCGRGNTDIYPVIALTVLMVPKWLQEEADSWLRNPSFLGMTIYNQLTSAGMSHHSPAFQPHQILHCPLNTMPMGLLKKNRAQNANDNILLGIQSLGNRNKGKGE